MRLLLDTNTAIWWFFDPDQLGAAAAAALADEGNETWFSAASLWEIAIKHKLGKLPQVAPLVTDDALFLAQGFVPLAITGAHALRAGALPLYHRDPFDRLLAAQSLIENLVVLSSDTAFDAYGVQRLWR